jgi:phosphoribosylaminoimidazole (AIR) synthetase
MKRKNKVSQNHFWDIIVNPKRYFTKIVADGNLDESMFKAFIYGLIGGCLVLGIRLLGGATITIGAIFTAVVIMPVLAVALLFVCG